MRKKRDNDHHSLEAADYYAKIMAAGDKPFMTVAETAAILGVSTTSVYTLAKRPYADFPSVRAGKRILIPRQLFVEWIQRECGKPSP